MAQFDYYYHAVEAAIKSGSLVRKVTRRRANKLLKKGVDIYRSPEGDLVWFMPRTQLKR